MQSLKSAFIIPSSFPCLISTEEILKIGTLFDLVDFGDATGEIYFRKVRFLNAYLKGYKLTIVLLDLKTGKMIKRKHRLNNESLPCDWVLMDTDVFKPKPDTDKKEIEDYCDGKKYN